MSDAPPLGYRQALAELDAILAELEDEAVDVDQLSVQVKRAGELIALCRQRITGARLEVTEIVARLDAVAPTGPGDAPGADDAPQLDLP